MAFTRKNLVTLVARQQRNRVLKNLTLFFLGASATLLLANADMIITTNISNVVTYLKQVVLTVDGTATSATGVLLDGSLGKVSATSFCDLSGSCLSIPTIASGLVAPITGNVTIQAAGTGDIILKPGNGGSVKMQALVAGEVEVSCSATPSNQCFCDTSTGSVECGGLYSLSAVVAGSYNSNGQCADYYAQGGSCFYKKVSF